MIKFKRIIRLLAVALLIGILGGIVGTAFHKCVDFVTEFRGENGYIVCFLPFAGLLIAFLYKTFKAESKMDTNRIIKAVKGESDVPLRMVPLIFSGTVLSHLFGASVGREGAALQLGGSIGYNVSKKLTKGDDVYIGVMSGMSAVFAALFGTPFAAAVFSFEVARVRLKKISTIVPCLISALTARYTAAFFGVSPIRFSNISFRGLNIYDNLKIAFLALMCGFLAFGFCYILHMSEKFFKRLIPDIRLKAFFGGCVIILMTFFAGCYDYNGAGMDIITGAMNADAKTYAFVIKILFTAVCVGCGFKGGEIVPAFFVGSTFGCVMASVLGIPPSVGACVGFVALFCGAVNCPFASVIIAAEIFGIQGILYFAVICAISYVFSGNISLYKEQGSYSI